MLTPLQQCYITSWISCPDFCWWRRMRPLSASSWKNAKRKGHANGSTPCWAMVPVTTRKRCSSARTHNDAYVWSYAALRCKFCRMVHWLWLSHSQTGRRSHTKWTTSHQPVGPFGKGLLQGSFGLSTWPSSFTPIWLFSRKIPKRCHSTVKHTSGKTEAGKHMYIDESLRFDQSLWHALQRQCPRWCATGSTASSHLQSVVGWPSATPSYPAPSSWFTEYAGEARSWSLARRRDRASSLPSCLRQDYLWMEGEHNPNHRLHHGFLQRWLAWHCNSCLCRWPCTCGGCPMLRRSWTKHSGSHAGFERSPATNIVWNWISRKVKQC